MDEGQKRNLITTSHRRGATTASGVARPLTASVSRVLYRRGFRPLRSDLSACRGVLAAMTLYRLVAVIKNPADDDFLVVRQAPPPPLPEEEYRSFVDSDLWDLPSAPLNALGGDRRSETVVEGAYSLLDDLDLEKFDVDSALDEVIFASLVRLS